MATKNPMQPPKCFFNSGVPKWWSEKVLKAGNSYDGLTVPIPLSDAPTLMFFEKAKKDVPESLAAEEYCHAEQAHEMGPVVWYITYEKQRRQYGYGKAPLEIAAKAAGKKGLDTPEKKLWWKNA